jgi:hypothetical protein
MKKEYSEKEIDNILQKLRKILGDTKLYHQETPCGLFCYYRMIGKRRKLLFYLNPRKKEVVLGISHRATDILERYPILKSLADETKTSVMKFSIKKVEDIEEKGIKKLIKLIGAS